MKKDQFSEVFFRVLHKIKRFLTSKDLFIFLFFLMISVSLWGLQAMRKTYETVIQIPLKYENIPVGYVQTAEVPDKLRLTISDRGSSLLNYRIAKRFFPITINLEEYIDQKEALSTISLEPLIQRQLNTGTQIIKITPEYIRFNFLQLKKKNLPVKLNHSIELSQQYTFSDTITIEPSEIEVYAPEDILDTMQYAYTDLITLQGLKDTIQQDVKLREVRGIVYSSPVVSVTVKAEPYTEKTVEVPVIITNVPSTRTLRIFPSVVNVSFQLGLSLYDNINASSFILTVDYKEIFNTENLKKIPVNIERQPDKIFNIKLNPTEVDYLIEEKVAEE